MSGLDPGEEAVISALRANGFWWMLAPQPLPACLEPITVDEVWNASRSSGTALVLTLGNEEAPRFWREEPDTRDWRERRALEANRHAVQGQRDENERRDFATLRVCLAVGYAFVNSRDEAVRRFVARLPLPDYVRHLITEQPLASFDDVYGYLTGEMDAHPRVARAAAEKIVNGGYRSRRESFAVQVERLWRGDGWLWTGDLCPDVKPGSGSKRTRRNAATAPWSR